MWEATCPPEFLDALMTWLRDDVVPKARGIAARLAAESGTAREAKVDDELRAAGIEPGHASLYPDQTVEG